MKPFAPTLAILLAALMAAGCGEKQSGTASAPDVAAKPMDQVIPPSMPPQATQPAEVGGHPGKAIHDANCISCHDSGVYTRADHKMTDFAMLSGQVRRCDANLGAKLSDDDIGKVIDYLNETYYKFPK